MMARRRFAALCTTAAGLFSPALRRMNRRAAASLDNHSAAAAEQAAYLSLTFRARRDRRVVNALKSFEPMPAGMALIFVCWHNVFSLLSLSGFQILTGINLKIIMFRIVPQSPRKHAPFRTAEIFRYTTCRRRNAARRPAQAECGLKTARSSPTPPVRRRRF